MKRTTLCEQWVATLTPALRITWEFLTAEQRAAVFAEYRQIVAEAHASPRKFALMAFRETHPREHLNAPDEALLIGTGTKKLRSLRENQRQP